MEIFVYVRMGGRDEDIAVKLLSEARNIVQSLKEFSAERARCFLHRDRQKLLAVIETSFGSCAPFNAIVRGMFTEKLSDHNDLGPSEREGIADSSTPGV